MAKLQDSQDVIFYLGYI